MRSRLVLLVGVVGLVSGCSGDDTGTQAGGTDYMDDQPPSGCNTEGCPATDGTTGDGTGGEDACKASSECADGELCAAPYLGDDRGPFACVPSCIENGDETMWCADGAACCVAGATCTARGYCQGGGGTGTGTGTGTGG